MKKIYGIIFATFALSTLTQAQTAEMLNFDGTNDYVNCGSILTPSYTKEAWIKITNLALNNNIISGGTADGLHALYAPSSTGNRLSSGHNGVYNAVQDPTPLLANTWYHVAVTYDATTTTMNLYKNGVLVSSNSSVPAYTTGTAVRLGAFNNAGAVFKGNMDEVRIWNYALTPAEINASMNCELAGTEPGLIVYYNFNQGVAGGNNAGVTTLIDIAAPANNGTLTNFALTGATSNWISPSIITTGTSCATCPVVTVSLSSQTNVSCNGGSNGSATVSASGGTSFTYSWAPSGGTAATASGLAAGIYTVTVTNQCSNTGTATVNITQPTALAVTPVSQTNISCNGGSNGAASVSTSGGTPAYTYNWTPGNPTGDGTASVTGLTAGTWTCTVTDANACTSTATFNITAPTAIVVAPVSQTNVSCNGGSNGAASVSTSGGTPAYTYNWTPGNPTGDGTASVTGLTAGTWTCTVTDANACTSTATFNITAPSAITLSFTQTNVSCFGSCNGSATVTPSGGTPGYTFSWAPSGGTGSTASGLCSGTYTCTVTDANGCVANGTVNITQPPVISISMTSTNVSCFGSCNGSATATATGGTGVYTYAWAPSGGSAAAATGLCAGGYTVTVSSPAGCSQTSSVNITQPTALSNTSSQINVTCNGGSNGAASVNVSGGTPSYSYNWTPGNPLGDGTATANGLTAGSWSCTITDANGCSLTQTFMITEPTAITGTFSTTNCTCFGSANGSATVTASGGAGTYTYSWAPTGGTTTTASSLAPATYSCTITDMNGCTGIATVTITEPTPVVINPSQTNITCFGMMDGTATVSVSGGNGGFTYAWTPTGGSGVTETGLDAGTYTCTATDVNGCNASQTFQITEPPQITYMNTSTDVTCFGNTDGTASIAVSGGVPGYSYSWAPGGYTTASVTGLAENQYLIDIMDASGCSIQDTITINAPSQILPSFVSTDVTCFSSNDGTATVSVVGGSGTYMYSWSPTGGSSPAESNLGPGTYTCTVTDSNGCVGSGTVAITQPTQLTTTTSQTDVMCFGGNTGSASVTPAGGSGSYTYSWAPSGGTAATESNLVAGNYTCTVTDINGCTTSNTFQITEPGMITISEFHFDETCFGGNNASISLNVTGGTGALSFLWSNGATTQNVNTLTAGTYTCTVTDANGCTSITSIAITEPATMMTNPTVTNVSCGGGSNGNITLSMTGGTAPYFYYWGNGGNAATNSGLTAGAYDIIIQDVNGCTIYDTITVTEPTALMITASVVDINCHGDMNGSATVTVSGGMSPYTYLWTTGGTATTETGLGAGMDTCIVTDANGCTIDTAISIIDPGAVNPFAILMRDPTTCGGTDGGFNMSASGGYGPYTYLWSTGATTEDLANLPAGVYTYTVTDTHGCTGLFSATLNDPGAPTVTLNLPVSTICLDDAAMVLSGESPSGGTFSGNGVTGNSFDPLTAGVGNQVIAYTFTDTLGCTGATSDTITVDPCTGIAHVGNVSDWNIYPNPTNGVFFINGTTTGEVHILCYSFNGTLVREITTTQTENITLDLSSESNGIYLVRVITSNGDRSFRLVKQN